MTCEVARSRTAPETSAPESCKAGRASKISRSIGWPDRGRAQRSLAGWLPVAPQPELGSLRRGSPAAAHGVTRATEELELELDPPLQLARSVRLEQKLLLDLAWFGLAWRRLAGVRALQKRTRARTSP